MHRLRHIGVSALVFGGMLVSLVGGSAVLGQGGDASRCARGQAAEERIAGCGAVIGDARAGDDEKLSALRLRAGAYAERGEVELAIGDLTEALRRKPESAHVLVARGQLWLGRGAFDEAIGDYAAALRANPRLTTAYIGRGYGLYAKGAYDEAIADFNAALKIEPGSAVALNNRGLAWRKKNDLAQAIADFSAAVTVNPHYALAFLNRGYAHEARGEQAAAAEDFQRALAINPGLWAARDALARLPGGKTHMISPQTVLAEGEALVRKNCAWCHAVEAQGNSPNAHAPRFRDLHKRYAIETLADPLSTGSVAPHSEMPRFTLGDRDIAAIIAYNNSLGPRR